MKRKNLFIILLTFIFCMLNFSGCSKENLVNLKNSKNLISGKLENGLEYYIYKNSKPENRASLNLVVKAGSLLETDEQQGIAHFLEHMAFNGTTKYKKNEIVKYLQSIGLSFGGDLNAYTSFSETVYKLQIPTTEKDLTTAFDIFKEWASEITLNLDDVENEKNIIMEEWRVSQGITKRIGDLQKKILFGDSRYSKRYPIGLPEIIQTTTPELLREYYEKWYIPKNMAVVAVGDFDVAKIEKMIKNNFSTLKNSKNINKKSHDLVSFSIPLSSKNSVEIFTDSEITNTNFTMIWKENISPVNTEKEFERILKSVLLNSILNTRFGITAKEKDAPYTQASIYNFSLNNSVQCRAVSALVKNNDLNGSINNLIENLRYIAVNGITEEELNREKLNMLTELKFLLDNKSSIENDVYMDSIVEYILKDNTFLDLDEEYVLVEKLLKNITADNLKLLVNEILKLNYDIIITSRENMKDVLPKEKDIENMVNSLLIKKDFDIKFNESKTSLPDLNLKNGSIINKQQDEYFTKFKLSNGIEVFYKKTDFDKDKISFQLQKSQGNSSLNFSEYINSLILPEILIASGVGEIDYKSLDQYFKGKIFSVSPFVKNYSQGFSIVTNKNNLDESLKYFRTLIKNPKFDENIIESKLKTSEEIIKNRIFSPNTAFREEYLNTFYKNHPRKVLLKSDDLKYITKENLEKTFNDLFSNFNNYKLAVVGSIDEKSLIPILNKYFSNLPVEKYSTTHSDLKIENPDSYIKKIVTKGIDKKALVQITFPYKDKYSLNNRLLYFGFSELLNILLIEDVREEIGGVYSISSYFNINKFSSGESNLSIFFSTEPKRVDEIVTKVKETILKIQNGNFPENKISDIQKNYALNFDTALTTNEFWVNYLNKKSTDEKHKFFPPTDYNEIVNFNSIIQFSNKALDINNGVEIILLPEKEE